nr:hypothetical protein [Tanacetum cinerariifolium]
LCYIFKRIIKRINDLSNFSDHPPQHQTRSFESYNDNPNYGYPPQDPSVQFQPRSIPSFINLLKKRVRKYCKLEKNIIEAIEVFFKNLDGDDDDDDYDKESIISTNTDIFEIPSSDAITTSPPVLPTEDPEDSLIIGNEDFNTVFEKESDKVIKSSVEDLVPIPSESEDILDNLCNVPFSDKNHFNAESDLIESLLTRDTSIVYSPKIDSLLEEFAGELVHTDPIPSRINETDSKPKDDIRFIDLEEVKDNILHDKLLNIHLLIAKIESLNNNPTPNCVLKSPSSSFLSYTNNSSPEFETSSYHTEETSSSSTTTHAYNSLPEYDLFLFEIEPNQDELTRVVMNDIPDNSTNDPLMEEINLFLTSDNSIPPGIENVDYDSEGDIFFKELLRNDSIPLPEFESFHFDLYDEASSPSPSKKPPEDGGILTTKWIAPDLESLSCSWFCPSSTRASIFSIWESDILDLINLLA